MSAASAQTMTPRSSPRAEIVRAVLWACALHVPIWVASAWFSMGWPLFSLDLLLAIVVLSLSWRWGWLTILIVYLSDAVWFVSQSYHFSNAAEFVDGGRFLSLLSLGDLVSLPALVMGLLVLGLVGLSTRWRARPPKAIWSLTLLVTIAVLDVVNGSTRLFGLGDGANHLNVNVAGSPMANQASLWVGKAVLSRDSLVPSKEHRLFDGARAWIEDPSPRGVLLVLVESMGEPATPGTRRWLHQQLPSGLGSNSGYSVDTEAFNGPTTYGELRSLCGLNGHYSHLTTTLADQCLPVVARRHGRTATALHGFALRMFDREVWWPEIGFDTPTWTQVPSDQVGCNHVYRGICDQTVLQTAVTASAVPRSFVYALTLDSHLPLARLNRPLDPALARACKDESVSDQSCALIAQTGAVLKLLGSQVAALPVEKRPRVVIAGDHAPPFLSQRDRNAFELSRIPVFRLNPDSASGQ